jgi:hypothetical protein
MRRAVPSTGVVVSVGTAGPPGNTSTLVEEIRRRSGDMIPIHRTEEEMLDPHHPTGAHIQNGRV